MTIILEQGYKFGVMAIPDVLCPQPLVPAGTEFAASRVLPDGAIANWTADIGRFHARELEECELFLWAHKRSENPEILDQENQLLARQVYDFYLGVVIATPYFCNGRVTRLTGANADGETRARSLTTYGRAYQTLGAPSLNLTVPKIKRAAQLAVQLDDHSKSAASERMVRAVRTFREATEAAPLDLRLHQFVRTAEAFAVPPFKNSGVRFARRLCRVCDGEPYEDIKELYDLRSGIEHLHGPYDRMPKGLDSAERHVRLLLRCVQAEALARFLLDVYMQKAELWPHFVNRPRIDAFWDLPEDEFRKLWPIKLAFDSILRDVDHAEVERRVREREQDSE